jgi:hypothetical protein
LEYNYFIGGISMSSPANTSGTLYHKGQTNYSKIIDAVPYNWTKVKVS